MIEKVRRWVEQEKLIEAGDIVLAGISGGADSVCLLHVMLSLQEYMDFSLEAVHVEHGIRGEESRDDALFVERLCAEHGVPCRTFHVDVPAYAAEKKLGMEEAARILRYACYREAAEQCEGGRVRIALAHHADDQAETVLFRLVRGSGIHGMCGMAAERMLSEGAAVIRPLLTLSRVEIEAHLRECEQMYRQDATNFDIGYSRNRIRHAVMPELAQINDRAAEHIAQSALYFSELSAYLCGEAERILAEMCRVEEGRTYWIGRELFSHYPYVLQKEVLYRLLGEAAGSRRDIGNVHIEELMELARLQVGRKIRLPYGLWAERVYEGIRIRRYDGKKSAVSGEEAAQRVSTYGYGITPEQFLLAEQGRTVEIVLPDGKMQFTIRKFSGDIQKIQKKTYTKWLDYDKIKDNLQVRTRAGGDYLTIDERGHRKKLKEYLIDEKVPADERDGIWLLADGPHIIWVVGGRISADYRVQQKTKRVLKVQMIGGKYHEDERDSCLYR